jgi:hypothetical protein
MSALPGNFSPASVGVDVNTSYLSKTHRINCFLLLIKNFCSKIANIEKINWKEAFENTFMKSRYKLFCFKKLKATQGEIKETETLIRIIK